MFMVMQVVSFSPLMVVRQEMFFNAQSRLDIVTTRMER
jgi:hypothetical protein